MNMESLRNELLGLLPDWGARVEGSGVDEASLIASGRIDSVGLFELLLWIEEKTGAPIDPGAVDWRREWDTVPGILDYIARRRNGTGSSGSNG
jgi:acyl carrier protein